MRLCKETLPEKCRVHKSSVWCPFRLGHSPNTVHPSQPSGLCSAGKSLTACDPPGTHLSPAKVQPECHVVPGTSQEPSTQCHTRMGVGCPYLLNSFLVQPLPVPQFTRTQYKTVPCIHSALSEYPDLTNSTSTNIMSKQNI